MSSLFTAVSVEQQEIVAGGSKEGYRGGRGRRQYDSIIDSSSNFYEKKKVSGGTFANKYGVGSYFDAFSKTDNYSDLLLKFNY